MDKSGKDREELASRRNEGKINYAVSAVGSTESPITSQNKMQNGVNNGRPDSFRIRPRNPPMAIKMQQNTAAQQGTNQGL